ncbi:MAG TPA: amino acid permease [Candidatus Xenobia bacterium]|nr:amino acid permease [Candidatus Xenobia bacterium]
MATQSALALAREIRLGDGVAIVVGGIIGSGIFLVPKDVSQQLDSFAGVLLVWIVGGALSLFGALALAELGAALPRTGGLYVYLSEAYGRPMGFLYGWGQLIAISSGTVATLAVAFGLYLSRLVPLNATEQKVVGVASVLLLTGVNCLGLRRGTWVQNVSTLAKVGGLGLVIVVLLARGRPLEMWSQSFWPSDPAAGGAGGLNPAWIPFGVALVAVLWAYEGWHIITFSAGEFKRVRPDLGRSLAIGTVVIVAIYLAANLAYYAALPGAEIAQSDTVAATAMTRTFGAGAAGFVSLLILISIFGANNAQILATPRMYYAMARDGLFFESLARVHPRYHTPVAAIVTQGVWASLLTCIGSFQQLFTYVVFTHWIFYALAVAGVVVLRVKRPELERPFCVPGYPLLPFLFVLSAAGLTLSVIVADPWRSFAGVAAILTGLPAYGLFCLLRHRKRKPPKA